MTKPCPSKSLFQRIEEQENEARQFGFYWEHTDQLIAQIKSECLEVQEAQQKNDLGNLKEEVGDLLHACVSLAIFLQLDPHESLAQSVEKFQDRYTSLVDIAKKDGLDNLQKQPYGVLMKYWNLAKLKVKVDPLS